MKRAVFKLTKTYYEELLWLSKLSILAIMIFIASIKGLHAQVSGGWDAMAQTGGASGYTNWGSGVIQLMNTTNTGCSGSAVFETTATYDPTLGASFSKCYQVFFGCPGGDNIGSDSKGDGMAFSFYKCAYNINNGLACGGGLGYMGSCAQMITIEFDTYSSFGGAGFDGSYGGGATGNRDEVAIHRDGIANDGGRLASADAGNLEDGMEHTVCITYTPGTRIMAITIDGNPILSYDMGPTYNLQTYFGAGGLSQAFSSGKFGATNPATVSDGANIAATMGTPLCPSGVAITSPSDGASFGGCPVGPITINATATPAAGNTVTSVEFFVDGVSIGTDFSAPYSMNWASPTNGAHALTVVADWSVAPNTTSSTVNITVGGGINMTSTAPTIDGTKEVMWNSYASYNLTKNNGATGNDLSGTYYIMYDAAALYVLVDVTDDIPNTSGAANWEKDGIEIYIDIGNNKVGCCSYGANDYQYTFVYGGGVFGNPGPTGGITFVKTNKAAPTGYIIEMRFPWATWSIGAPAAGTNLGFDVSVNDDDNGGTRDNQISWNDGTFGEWQNPSLFGTLQFTNCNPLPISLISFTGEKVGETVLLDWTTIVEINNEKFVVERSNDMNHWEAIGEVAGAGNSVSLINYNFTDTNPLDGISYYRLRQVDFDGTSSYSNIVSVQTTAETSVSISPNPFDDVITIESNSHEDMEISIYDVLGRVLYQTTRKGNDGILSIHPELATGAYIITVRTNEFVKQQKIIKK